MLSSLGLYVCLICCPYLSCHVDWNRPICRTVSDVVYVLDEIVGLDYRDKATIKASLYIPRGGYKQFLKANGLRGKRLGIVRKPFFDFDDDVVLRTIFEQHLKTLR